MSRQCDGITRRGNRCGNITSEQFCHLHEQSPPVESRFALERCSICLEENQPFENGPLSCGHWVHRECIIQSGNMECPLCRKALTGFTPEERIRCIAVSQRMREERIEEEAVEIRHAMLFEVLGRILPLSDEGEEQFRNILNLSDMDRANIMLRIDILNVSLANINSP